MSTRQDIGNEKIIPALLQNGTITAAAKSCGLSARTLSERMKDSGFAAEYAEAKTEVLRRAVANLSEKLNEAVDTVAAIMKDDEVNAAVRLQAAQTIMTNAGKLSDRLCDAEKATRNLKDIANDPWRL